MSGKWVGNVNSTVVLIVPTVARVIEMVPDVSTDSVNEWVHKVTHLNFSVARVTNAKIDAIAWVVWLGKYIVGTSTPA